MVRRSHCGVADELRPAVPAGAGRAEGHHEGRQADQPGEDAAGLVPPDDPGTGPGAGRPALSLKDAGVWGQARGVL